MRGKSISGLLLMLLLIFVLPLVFNVQLVEAAISPYSPAGGIYVVPNQVRYTATVYCQYNETTFTVEVNMANFTGVAGYQLRIDYNSTLLSLHSWTFDTGTPMTPTQVAPASSDRIDTDISVPGSVQVATIWKSGIPPYSYSGNATAAELTFQIIYCPPVPMFPQQDNTVSTPLAFNSNQTFAYDINGNDILFTNFGDGYYEYTTETHWPPPIFVAVEADPSVLMSGETSTITVNVTWESNDPVDDALVVLFSDNGGSFSPSSGFTDYNGIFTSTFTAPHVTTETNCTITAGADKVETGGENQTQVTVKPPSVVGGIYIPVNKLSPLTPYIGLTILLAVAVATVVYAKKRKKQ